jgi:hypothetical protein
MDAVSKGKKRMSILRFGDAITLAARAQRL